MLWVSRRIGDVFKDNINNLGSVDIYFYCIYPRFTSFNLGTRFLLRYSCTCHNCLDMAGRIPFVFRVLDNNNCSMVGDYMEVIGTIFSIIAICLSLAAIIISIVNIVRVRKKYEKRWRDYHDI